MCTRGAGPPRITSPERGGENAGQKKPRRLGGTFGAGGGETAQGKTGSPRYGGPGEGSYRLGSPREVRNPRTPLRASGDIERADGGKLPRFPERFSADSFDENPTTARAAGRRPRACRG